MTIESKEDLEQRWQQVSICLRHGDACLIPWSEDDSRNLLDLRQQENEKKK